MVASHIHHALAQVRELQQKILEKQRFKGYSGRARAISGTLALLAAAIMSSERYPAAVATHLAGWGVVFALAVLLDLGGILYCFLFDGSTRREIRRLSPMLDVLPPLAIGGVFSIWMLMYGLHSSLFGCWMCLYGLANLAARHVVPRAIWI